MSNIPLKSKIQKYRYYDTIPESNLFSTCYQYKLNHIGSMLAAKRVLCSCFNIAQKMTDKLLAVTVDDALWADFYYIHNGQNIRAQINPCILTAQFRSANMIINYLESEENIC